MFSLVILAAGLGSRYGGIKQVKGFGLHNEKILEYSIYDAIKVGFTEVIFIIRKEHHQIFKEEFESKISKHIQVKYAFQEIDSFLPANFDTKERKKPWGTAHALLTCKDIIKNPFAVINADDLYGTDSFIKAIDFLKPAQSKMCSLIGYEINKTLSSHGTVSRGVCDFDVNGNLIKVTERLKIYRRKSDNQIVYFDNENEYNLAEDTIVSMNFFCFDTSIFKYIELGFNNFLQTIKDRLKSEYYLPLVVDELINNYNYTCKVIQSNSQWYGVTYIEDDSLIKEGIKNLIDNKVYPEKLW
ncbi:MAG: sugar phosphate nucleotidyltransferase [Sediminibacterium sp.]|nr:sugar phosphate nucleotidyltransferase [Sediminibacterium sp.]